MPFGGVILQRFYKTWFDTHCVCDKKLEISMKQKIILAAALLLSAISVSAQRLTIGGWWAFLLVGLAATAASLFTAHYIWSTLLGVFAFSCFWSILEVFEQQKRVEKGWFPANPKRKTNTISKTPKN